MERRDNGKKPVKDRMTHISQVGIVVRDLSEAESAMEKIFGVKPDYRGTTPDLQRYYKGRVADFAASMIFYNFANIELEFIQPVRGESDWNHFLADKGEGLHHIRFSVDDWEGTTGGLRENGVSVLMEGRSVKGDYLRWGVMDTEQDLSFQIEIFNEFENPPDEEKR